MRRTHYYQLDASFRAMDPYVIVVPLAIINNFGVPLGLVVTPTERSGSFSLFWTEMQLSHEDLAQLVFGKPLLSDSGTSLIAYGASHIRHYLCFRHILERLGSRTYVAILARRLMFCANREHYAAMREQSRASLEVALHENLVTPQGCALFSRTFGFTVAPDSVVSIVTPDPFESQALWGTRGDDGVSTCSNHIEGLHGRLNHSVAARRVLALHRRFQCIVDHLTIKTQETRLFMLRSPRRKWDELVRLAKEQKQNPERKECDCGWGRVYSQRFGIPEFPCVHTILSRPPFDPAPGDWQPQTRGPTIPVIEKEYVGPSWPCAGARGGNWETLEPTAPETRNENDNQEDPEEQIRIETEEEVDLEIADDAHVSGFLRNLWRELMRLDPDRAAQSTLSDIAYEFGVFDVNHHAPGPPNPKDPYTRAAFEIRVLFQRT
jgi:hypothetical protein